MGETIKKKDVARTDRQEADLDEGLDETFPASDAPSATQPGSGRREDGRPSQNGSDSRADAKRG